MLAAAQGWPQNHPLKSTMFTALVAYLAQFEAACPEHEWQDWHIRPVASGNNRLFRATRDADLQCALK